MGRHRGVRTHSRGGALSSLPASVWWAFLTAGLALAVILIAFAIALVVNQRRFVALHRTHADRLLRAQEEERAWVAREVHDDALQRITLLLHEIEGWGAEPAVTQRASTVRAELEDLSTVLRRLAYRLHPSILEQQGLLPALQRLAAELSQASGVRLHVNAELAAGAVPRGDRALVAYRVAQEALNNLIRHAQTKEGHVRVGANNGHFTLEVTDQGRGFRVDPGGAGQGLGLISMAERARAAGGSLTITSEPGAGTRVRLRLPTEHRA